ncbi:hypothetical protein [Jiulongibacter sediminis]|nr:hypothetical protein [Jiulongibacter sediminis]
MKKNIINGLLVGAGVILYHYFAHGTINWARGLGIAVITTILMIVFDKLRK